MVNTAFSRKLFEQPLAGSCDRKGIGYTIEAFVAVLTLLIFAMGTLNSPASQDWNRFQSQVEARDIGYVLQATGNLEGFLERDETGSIQTVASTITGGRLDVAGDIQGLPLGERRIGFHVLDSQVNNTDPVELSPSVDDNRCYENDDLGEINITEPAFDAPILRTEDRHHGVYLYVTDRDPQIPGGSGETDYDSVWVDNGTRCQFSSSEGPYYQDEFFWWGNTSDGEPDLHYDLKNITDGGDLVLYEAEQPVRFRKVIHGEVNDIKTTTSIDTFRFSAGDLESYDTLVFRQQQALEDVNDNEEQVMDYLEDNSALFLMDLDEDDFDSGFMPKTGLKWKAVSKTSPISGVRFTDTQDSGRVENLFLGQSGDKNGVSLQPGGNVTSGSDGLVRAAEGRYRTDEWNATNMSMADEDSPPSGVADSSCPGGGNYTHGTFTFDASGETVEAWNSELGDNCAGDRGIWGLSIDLNGDGSYESGEKIFVTGDTVTFEGREYTVKIYPESGDCDPGSCAELVYSGSRKIEVVNARTYFPEREIGRFARAGYESRYSLEDRRLLSAVIYWLGGRQNSFGGTSGGLSTTTVGGVKNSVYMPYRVSLQWN